MDRGVGNRIWRDSLAEWRVISNDGPRFIGAVNDVCEHMPDRIGRMWGVLAPVVRVRYNDDERRHFFAQTEQVRLRIVCF